MFTTVLKIVAKSVLIFGASYAASEGAAKVLDIKKDYEDFYKEREEEEKKNSWF